MEVQYEMFVTPEQSAAYDPEIAHYLASTGSLVNYMVYAKEQTNEEAMQSMILQHPDEYSEDDSNMGSFNMTDPMTLDVQELCR